MVKEKTSKEKKRAVRNEGPNGKMYITATFNNTLVTVTDKGGNTVAWGSAGRSGFKGARKATPYAATSAVEQVARLAETRGIRNIEVYIKGPGFGRDAALRGLRGTGLSVSLIADITPIPHNGPRPKKKRRV